MDDIFISYASQDRERARDLATALEARGWSVWWDREIPLGRSYDEVIEQALAGARCMLVLWSAAAAASEWVRSEASEGKRRGILVPVFLENVDAPLAFRLLNGARLEHWQAGQSHPEFERLVQRVAELLASPAKAAPRPQDGATHAVGHAHTAATAGLWQRMQALQPRALAAIALFVLLVAGGIWLILKPPSTPPDAIATRDAPAPPAAAPAASAPPATAPAPALPNLEEALTSLGVLPGAALPDASHLALRAFRIPALALSLVYVTPTQSRATGAALPAGAVVWEVMDGAAQRGGVQVLDVLVAIDGKTLRGERDLRRRITAMGSGRHVWRVQRDGAGLNLTLDCAACESVVAAPAATVAERGAPVPRDSTSAPAPPKPARPTAPSGPGAATSSAPSPAAPATTQPDPTTTAPRLDAAPVPVKPAAAAKTTRPTLAYAVLGLPTYRSFWNGETRASYHPKLRAAIRDAGQDVLRMDMHELSLASSAFDAWWNESGQSYSRKLCAASPPPAALLSARVETPFVNSSIESAYWPELSLRLYLCDRNKLYRYQKTLSPLNADAWPFSTEFNGELEKFLRLYREDVTR